MLYKTFAFTVDSTETDGTTVQILLNRQDAKEETTAEKLLIVDDEEIELDGMAESSSTGRATAMSWSVQPSTAKRVWR